MRVAILDTGAGNLHSLGKALVVALPEAEVTVASSALDALSSDLMILPGVGAFGSAAARIADGRERLRDALADGHPCIGICLGMQLLFTSSEEGPGQGIGIVAGEVTRLRSDRSPHMGWTPVDATDHDVAAAAPSAVYFAHSFACRPSDTTSVLATSTVGGDRFASIVRVARTIGVQFHPEKSSKEGVTFLGWLARLVTADVRGAT